MSPLPEGVLLWGVRVSMTLLALGLLLAFYRLVRGPSSPDRIVALDVISGLSIGLVSTYAVYSRTPELLGVAAAIALIAFLGTVAVARYLEKSVER